MNYIDSEEPFSIHIFVRKKFIKHEEMKVGLEEKNVEPYVNENADLNDAFEEASKAGVDLNITNNFLHVFLRLK